MVPHRILIVEDESLVAADLEDRLRQLGYVVAGRVDTGEDAVRATLRKISGIEADRLAQTLVKLSIRLLRSPPPNTQESAEVRLQVGGGGSVVQLFPG